MAMLGLLTEEQNAVPAQHQAGTSLPFHPCEQPDTLCCHTRQNLKGSSLLSVRSSVHAHPHTLLALLTSGVQQRLIAIWFPACGALT
jgi:hypothetical protein